MKISEEERQKRQKAVDFARGSVRLEGFILDERAEALAARYINGEISMPEMIAGASVLAGLLEEGLASPGENLDVDALKMAGVENQPTEKRSDSPPSAGDWTMEKWIASLPAWHQKLDQDETFRREVAKDIS